MQKLKMLKPYILIFISLGFGISTILISLDTPPALASLLLVISCYFYIISNTKKSKVELEQQIDSLITYTCFIIAPAILMWKKSLQSVPTWGIICVAIFICSAIIKIALLNVNLQKGVKSGLPIHIGGTVLALVSSFSKSYYYITIITCISVCILLFTKIRIKRNSPHKI